MWLKRMGFVVTQEVMIVVLVTLGSVDSALLTATYKSRSTDALQTVDVEYNGIPSSQFCSLLCTERTATKLTACFSYSYNSASQICKLSPDWNTEVAGPTTNDTVFEVQDTIKSIDKLKLLAGKEYYYEASTYNMIPGEACRREFVQPVIGFSFQRCIDLQDESSTSYGEFSYDAAQQFCYRVVPMLTANFTCPIDDAEVVPILSRAGAAPSKSGITTKLPLAGPFSSSDPYVGEWNDVSSVTIAFDGSTEYGNHYLSARGTENPWIGGDIGDIRTVTGAKFYTRTNCCAKHIQNIHFLVATAESSLTDDYDVSLCSIYPGSPTMKNHDVVWFPCPFKQGRYFKMVSFTASGNIDVCEVELFGY